MNQPDLFTQQPYGGHAGYQHTQTSIDAARVVTPGIRDAHRAILDVLRRESLTPDEIADRLKWDKLYVRPRCTELKEMNLVEKTGERRANRSNLKANVLRVRDRPRSIEQEIAA